MGKKPVIDTLSRGAARHSCQ